MTPNKAFMMSLAHGAGDILMKYFHRKHRITVKPGAGIVTEADKGAENYLIKKIFSKFPKSSIITEESGSHDHGSELLWIIDPLDGTTNYAHGFPWFCTSIGVYRDGVGVAGVVYNPFHRELFYAEKGKGAFLNGKRIRVSTVAKMDAAVVGTGFYYSKGKALKEEMKIFSRMNELALGVRRPGSAALDLAQVATGRYDGFWERRLSSWDVAAGFLLVEEAGGQLSNYSGKVTDLFEGELVASNGRIHQRLVKEIQSSLKD